MLGFWDPTPSLSWVLEADADETDVTQTAYRVHITGAATHDTGWVTSDRSQHVGWPGTPLTSRARVTWQVQVRTNYGETAWSSPQELEAGLLDGESWKAQLVGPADQGRNADPLPAWDLRRSFDLPDGVSWARVHATAHGVYELRINGYRVGDEVLAPGWTAYQRRLSARTHDVRDLLHPGANIIEATLAEGWYRGRMGWQHRKDLYGDRLGIVVQLEIGLASGAVALVTTDASWESRPSVVEAAGIYDGERVNVTAHLESWAPVEVLQLGEAGIEPAGAPPVRAIAVVSPTSVERRAGGRLLVDFGQNLVGRLRFALPAGASPGAGETVEVRHAEVLTGAGELRTDLLRSAQATDAYTTAGGPLTWEPRFTFHGFRYAEVTGLPPGAEHVDAGIQAVVLSTDLPDTGTFRCSDEHLNRLHDNVRWSLRGNFLSLPTDCPQRDERLGWTGDAQVFAPTALFLVDAYRFLDSWLEDARLEQRADGAIPFVVPNILGAEAAGAAGWADVITCMPWDVFVATGDPAVLARNLPAMIRWVDYQLDRAGADLLWTGDFQFGDWLDPDAPAEKPASAKARRDLVATAYMARSLRIVADTSRLLGDEAVYARYRPLAAGAARAWWEEWGEEAQRTQTGCALALQFALAPEAERAAVAEALALLVGEAGDHLGTGFLGTPLLLPALAGNGYLDEAYRVLLQTTPPSWLFPVLLGATTIWERWDALKPDGTVPASDLAATGRSMVSFNHYAYGAVAEWLHTTVAGLAPDPDAPGYRRIIVRPRPGGGLSSARATLVTPYGPAAVGWTLDQGQFALDVTVPPGAEAEVHLPDGRGPIRAGSGDHSWLCPTGSRA